MARYDSKKKRAIRAYDWKYGTAKQKAAIMKKAKKRSNRRRRR